MKLTLGEERVIVQGMRPEENPWGAYQFPCPYDLGDRLVVGVHVDADDIRCFGTDNRWFESRDKGATWREVGPETAAQCGVRLNNGDRIYFPMESGISLKNYRLTEWTERLPNYDRVARAEEGTLPVPDGVTAWFVGRKIYAYNADRLPPSLAKKQWLMKRIPAGQTEPVTEYAQLDWPYLTRVVHMDIPNGEPILKPIFPRGRPQIGPDGAIWVPCFSGEGHLNPENGWYSPYYSAEIFRSEDNGRTFTRRAHMEYEADNKTYPYASGGFSDSDFAFMPDGSMVWFMRSNWYGSTGEEWSPMYFSRSEDMGRTWTKPKVFSDIGTLPRLCSLKCGVTLVIYARPGMYISACADGRGLEWSAPVELMTGGDRSALANVKIEHPTFHQWDGACNNPELIPISDDTALIFYSDFYYPDETGVKRKTILCRTVTVAP